MRINLYTEAPDVGPGGSEQFLAVIAEALSETHEVTIAHHKPAAAEAAWGELSGCDLSRVAFRHVAMELDPSSACRTPWSRYRAARAWRREITDGCDLFIGFFHNKPPFCHAKRGAMVILFPTYQPSAHFDDGRLPTAKPSQKKKKKKKGENGEKDFVFDFFSSRILRRCYGRWEWKRRMASYQTNLAISSFSREWAAIRWGVDCRLLHPPVAMPASVPVAKANRIVSIGRFATTGHTKKQLELLQAFRELRNDLPGWSYSSLGGLNDSPADRDYFESAAAFREADVVEVEANVERARLLERLASAKIFWHAAGVGDDLAAQPEMAEHFGLSTVEAMAHGCVPVVVKLGGQREIVEHGVNGFLWNSFAEMQEYTRQLAVDPALWRKMSDAARIRAQDFSRERCLQKLLDYLRPNET